MIPPKPANLPAATAVPTHSATGGCQSVREIFDRLAYF
jgi:hypothetical protein